MNERRKALILVSIDFTERADALDFAFAEIHLKCGYRPVIVSMVNELIGLVYVVARVMRDSDKRDEALCHEDDTDFFLTGEKLRTSIIESV